jgi:hypothetical protein
MMRLDIGRRAGKQNAVELRQQRLRVAAAITGRQDQRQAGKAAASTYLSPTVCDEFFPTC